MSQGLIGEEGQDHDHSAVRALKEAKPKFMKNKEVIIKAITETTIKEDILKKEIDALLFVKEVIKKE